MQGPEPVWHASLPSLFFAQAMQVATLCPKLQEFLLQRNIWQLQVILLEKHLQCEEHLRQLAPFEGQQLLGQCADLWKLLDKWGKDAMLDAVRSLLANTDEQYSRPLVKPVLPEETISLQADSGTSSGKIAIYELGFRTTGLVEMEAETTAVLNDADLPEDVRLQIQTQLLISRGHCAAGTIAASKALSLLNVDNQKRGHKALARVIRDDVIWNTACFCKCFGHQDNDKLHRRLLEIVGEGQLNEDCFWQLRQALFNCQCSVWGQGPPKTPGNNDKFFVSRKHPGQTEGSSGCCARPSQ